LLGPKNQFEEFLDTLKDTGAVNIGTIEKNAKQSNFIVAVGDNDSKHENHIEGHESIFYRNQPICVHSTPSYI